MGSPSVVFPSITTPIPSVIFSGVQFEFVNLPAFLARSVIRQPWVHPWCCGSKIHPRFLCMYFQLFCLRFSLPFLVFPITNSYLFSMRFPPALIHSFLSLPPGISSHFPMLSLWVPNPFPRLLHCAFGASYRVIFSCSQWVSRAFQRFKLLQSILITTATLGTEEIGRCRAGPFMER